jgi:hypothetical protein
MTKQTDQGEMLGCQSPYLMSQRYMTKNQNASLGADQE